MIPFGAAHTYMAYIWEYPPPPPPGCLLRWQCNFSCGITKVFDCHARTTIPTTAGDTQGGCRQGTFLFERAILLWIVPASQSETTAGRPAPGNEVVPKPLDDLLRHSRINSNTKYAKTPELRGTAILISTVAKAKGDDFSRTAKASGTHTTLSGMSLFRSGNEPGLFGTLFLNRMSSILCNSAKYSFRCLRPVCFLREM